MGHTAEHVFRAFTPLLESGTGGSTRAGNGRRVYPGVTVIKAGLGNQRDRNFYPFETLEAAVNSGAFRGLRAYADHPDAISEEAQPERTIRDMVGVYKNPRAVREGKNGGRVTADLHLFRSAKWLSDTVDDLIELGQADKIGLSINGRGRTVEKQITLEESADPINVNWVEDFLVLRSADVVTEAGAGGGFQQLLESARGSVKKETVMKLTEQNKKALREAVDAGDPSVIVTLLRECGVEMPKGKAKRAPVEEADEADVDEADDLDEAAEEITAEADADAAAEGSEAADAEGAEGDEAEVDDVDEAEADDAEEAADEDDIEESLKTVTKKGAGKLIAGRAHGKHGKTIKGPKDTKGSFTTRGRQNGGQPGRKFGEAEREALLEENARLKAQLRVRTTTDRARNLLRESAIPEKMRPDVLRLLVGKDERQMRHIIGYHERMIETAIEESVGSAVEGAGSRFRESYGGGRDNTDIGEVISEVGLPVKS